MKALWLARIINIDLAAEFILSVDSVYSENRKLTVIISPERLNHLWAHYYDNEYSIKSLTILRVIFSEVNERCHGNLEHLVGVAGSVVNITPAAPVAYLAVTARDLREA